MKAENNLINEKYMDYQKLGKRKLKEWFERFAEKECIEVSPLYYFLANEISKDEELLNIASFCKQRQPMPNLFLASVHYLLINNPSRELANYYPSITKDYRLNLPFKLFKEFCINNKEEIIELEQTKIVQTNALNRCAYLMPILSSLFNSTEINIIDIGTSAGLTLNLDKYEYHYNNRITKGESAVKIRSEIRSGELPKFESIINIKNKIGIDQNPLDVKIEENANWLKALIWADITERVEKIEQAISIAQQENIQYEKAKSIFEFEQIILDQDNDIPLVVFHTHTLYQFTPEERKEFWNLMDAVGSKRDLVYLATEYSKVLDRNYGIDGVIVELTDYQKGAKSRRLIAETNGHANWIKWN